ncbi:hypothetical protein [Faecalibacterium prausnitzii]|uniref:hypothetical protein n=1 Tax=Faecalibacterium prausnitzii TaxID=853 RepID=UPI00117B6E70|nr:hypothetical protein [Faecalibacterium prausnitzii]
MQKKTKKLMAAVVMGTIIILAAVGFAAARPAGSGAASESVSGSSEAAREPTSSAASASSPASSAVSEPADSAVASEEPAESDSVSESEPASSSEAASSSASSSDAAHSQPASSAASSHPAASHPASGSEPSSTPSSSASAESAVDAKINAYVQEIKALQKRTQRKLYRAVCDSYDEYIAHPVEERSLALKVSVVLGKSNRLNQIQNECDAEFNTIIKELRQYLTDNGRDQSIADQAEQEYKTEKEAMTKELTNLTYSQVTGKGEGAQWIQDHYAEWGS